MEFWNYVAGQSPSLLQQGADLALLDGREVRGAFSGDFQGGRLGGVPTDITDPTFYLPELDLLPAGMGSTLQVHGAVYTVVRVKPDGAGWAFLVLRLES